MPPLLEIFWSPAVHTPRIYPRMHSKETSAFAPIKLKCSICLPLLAPSGIFWKIHILKGHLYFQKFPKMFFHLPDSFPSGKLAFPCWPLLAPSGNFLEIHILKGHHYFQKFPKMFFHLPDSFPSGKLAFPCWPLLAPSGNFLEIHILKGHHYFQKFPKMFFHLPDASPSGNFLVSCCSHSKDISQDAFQGNFSFCSYKAEVFYLSPLAGPFWDFLENTHPQRTPIFSEISQNVFPPA